VNGNGGEQQAQGESRRRRPRAQATKKVWEREIHVAVCMLKVFHPF
jgi:hypothetical protein